MGKQAMMRWIGRSRRMSGAAVRFCLAIYLVLQIVCTSIHVYLEPHSDYADTRSGEVTPALGCVGHDSDSDHERHSAAQHDLKALRTQRAPVAELAVTTVTECLVVDHGRADEPVPDCSGLSPPELLSSWQFVFRAALPVRAPSLTS